MTTRILPYVAAALAVGALASCGGDAGNQVVVRVGGRAITKAMVDHWTLVMSHDAAAVDPSSQSETYRRQALGYLISSDWIVGEASEQGIPVSTAEVAGQLQQKQSSVVDGENALAAFVKWAGRTKADLKLEIERELATTRLQQSLVSKENEAARPSHAAVLNYYEHTPSFVRPEHRRFEIVEHFPTAAAAQRVMRSVAMGKDIASVAIHESGDRPSKLPELGPNGRIHTAIFRARPGVLIGPLPLNNLYAFFEVRHITPRGREPLARVERSIEHTLAGKARQRTHAAFLAHWRSTWMARTTCRPGFVVQQCARYQGPITTEQDPFAPR